MFTHYQLAAAMAETRHTVFGELVVVSSDSGAPTCSCFSATAGKTSPGLSQRIMESER